MAAISFTVFTPTFNRCDLLARTYESLCEQTFQDFEWLIVDDGSTDDTLRRVQAWQQAARFSIRYIYQHNSGKHRAHNRAIAQAAGELFAVLDSDDTLVPRAIERLIFHWNSIPEPERIRFSGVSCLCVEPGGRLVGRTYPTQALECRHYEMESVHRVSGEKWGCHRTAILRQFEFPDIADEKYCPEGIVWNRIARNYFVRHVNEALRVYRRHSGSMTVRPFRTLMDSPRYARMFYRECLDLEAPTAWRCKKAVNYVRYSLHAGVNLWHAVADSAAPVLTALLAPAGGLYYLRDILRRRNAGSLDARVAHAAFSGRRSP